MMGPAHSLKPSVGPQMTGEFQVTSPSHTCLSQQLHPWPISVPLFANSCLCPAGTDPVAAGLQPRSVQAGQHHGPGYGLFQQCMPWQHIPGDRAQRWLLLAQHPGSLLLLQHQSLRMPALTAGHQQLLLLSSRCPWQQRRPARPTEMLM